VHDKVRFAPDSSLERAGFEPSVPPRKRWPWRDAPWPTIVVSRDDLCLGCVGSSLSGTPIRLQGDVGRDDGMQELYRAAFIGLTLDGSLRQPFVLGAFNCRVVEHET